FGLEGMGPVGVGVGLAEVWVTAWLVERLNPSMRGLARQVVEPFVTLGVLLLGACLAAPRLVEEGVVAQALVGAVLFAILVWGRERLPGALPLLGELRQILEFVRARRAARPAPVSPAST
ncbi:polysaccharide biosynthesis protein, partial [Myxococcus sp. AM009]|nr:polysaccharide biosynthesis protein [Myxococcus sp. AM009]